MSTPWQDPVKRALGLLLKLIQNGDGNKFTGYYTPHDKLCEIEQVELILEEAKKILKGD